MRRLKGRGVGLAIFFAAAALLSAPGLRGCDEARLTAASARGTPAELVLTRLDGAVWRLSAERGHVVAVNLWATWCGPCRAETPALVQLSQTMSGDGFRVVGVSLDTGSDRAARVAEFANAYHVRYPLALASPLSQLDQAVDALPTTLLFDREGRLAMRYVGAIREARFRADVVRLLAER